MSTGTIVGDSLYEVGGFYYSPPMARGGLAGVFIFQVTHISGAMKAEVQHRNSEDTSWVTLSSFTNPIGAAGQYSVNASGVKEILRYVFFPTTTNAKIHVYIQEPSWRPYA